MNGSIKRSNNNSTLSILTFREAFVKDIRAAFVEDIREAFVEDIRAFTFVALQHSSLDYSDCPTKLQV